MFLSKGGGVSQGVREETLWIFGRISDRRHGQCEGPVAGIHLMGCRVHEEVRSLRQSEGRMEGNEGGERIAEDRSQRTQRHCRASGVDSEGGGAPGGWSR